MNKKKVIFILNEQHDTISDYSGAKVIGMGL